MIVRDAIENDLDAICILSNQINSEHHLHVPNMFKAPEGLERDRGFWKDRMCSSNGAFFVAELNAQIVGFITAAIRNKIPASFLVKNKICHIGTIVVSTAVQGQGVGKKLMASAEQWAKDEGAGYTLLEVMEFNKNAHTFYDSIGYDNHSRMLIKPVV